MRGIIYKATNTLNGKVYIGQTVSGLPARKKDHMRDAKTDVSNAFHVALYQYPNAFEWEVIDSFSGTKEQVIHALNVAEEYHILTSHSTDPHYGYNSTYGGYSSDKFAEQIKRRAKAFGGSAKQLLQYSKSGDFIREFASLKEVSSFLKRDKVSPKDLITGLHYGFQWRLKENEYFPRKITAYSFPSTITHKTAVAVYRSDGLLVGEYETIKEALDSTNKKSARIRSDIGNIEIREHQARDFYYFRLGDVPAPNFININIKRKQIKPKTDCRKAVSCYSQEGELINTYESISEAHRVTGMAGTAIRRYCEMREPIVLAPNSQAKYIWQYSDEKPKPKIAVIDHRAKMVEKMTWKIQPDGTKKREPVIVSERKANKYKKKMEHRIIQYSLQGQFIKVWENANIAAESQTDNYSAIYSSLRGKQGKKTNYIWRYYSDNYPEQLIANNPTNTDNTSQESVRRKDDTILEIDKAGKVISTYKNTSEAAEKSGFSQSYICNVLAGRIRHPKRRFKRP